MTKILVYWNLAKEGLFGLVTSWSPMMVWGARVGKKKKKIDDNFKNLKRKIGNMNK